MKKKNKDKLIGLFMLVIGIVYLLNFGFGFLEILPDNLPFIGNIDEGVAGGLIILGAKKLGIIK